VSEVSALQSAVVVKADGRDGVTESLCPDNTNILVAVRGIGRHDYPREAKPGCFGEPSSGLADLAKLTT
jgi:hypothetical protein